MLRCHDELLRACLLLPACLLRYQHNALSVQMHWIKNVVIDIRAFEDLGPIQSLQGPLARPILDLILLRTSLHIIHTAVGHIPFGTKGYTTLRIIQVSEGASSSVLIASLAHRKV